MKESDRVSDTFTASVTPIPESFATTSIHTVWENTGPVPQANEKPGPGQTKPRRAILVFDFSRYPNLGLIAATILLIVGFTALGFVDWRRPAPTQQVPVSWKLSERREQGSLPVSVGLTEQQLMQYEQSQANDRARVIWASVALESKAPDMTARLVEEAIAIHEREEQLQAARKELPSFGGSDTPSVLNAAERERLKRLVLPTLPQQPSAKPGEGEGKEYEHVDQSKSQLASYERRELR